MPLTTAESRVALLAAIGVCECADCATVPPMLDAYVDLCVAEAVAALRAETDGLRLFYEQSMAQARELYGDEFESSDKEPTP